MALKISLSGLEQTRGGKRSRTLRLLVAGTIVASLFVFFHGRGQRDRPREEIYQLPKPIAPTLTHLVMVPCHAIYLGAFANPISNLNNWLLTAEQTEIDTRAYLAHIDAGVNVTLQDPQALLIFSGGQTRDKSEGRTEAGGYMQVAETRHGQLSSATTETFARDSYENLMFSIARFHEYTGRWPVRITVVGFAFKEARFFQLHRKAVRFAERHFQYIGIDYGQESDQSDALTAQRAAGEALHAVNAFAQDLYGCRDPQLRNKRLKRNPARRWHPYLYSAGVQVAGLIAWCPADGVRLFDGALPWPVD
ncbi:hypothetical protein PYCC9005_002100 [Savitreella phatthalungensis]